MPGVFVDDSSKLLGIFALAFAGFGLVLAVAFTTYTFILIVVGVFCAVFGLLMLVAVVTATCTIDETTGQLRVATVRAYCIRGEEAYPLNSVLGAELQAQVSTRGRTLYRVAIILHSSVVAWAGWSNMGVATKTAFVQQFNQYLSTVRGGAPIVIPAAGVPVVMPHGGALPVTPQHQHQHQHQQPFLGVQPQPHGQPQPMVYVPYNGMQPLPLASQPQPQPQMSPQYHAVTTQQYAQPQPQASAPPPSYNPYAVQTQASAPPPPYNAAPQPHGTSGY